jgi:hypothetical protein
MICVPPPNDPFNPPHPRGFLAMNAVSDRLLLDARNDSIQLEQIAVADLDRNIDGYLEPNWRTRRMVDAWGRYVANNGKTDEAEYLNMRAAYSETRGRSNKVFSDVLAMHTRNTSYDLSDTLFKSYVAPSVEKGPVEKADAAVTMLSGEDDMVQTDDAWANIIQGGARHLEVHGWWKSKVLAPEALVKSLKAKIEARMLREHADGLQAAYEGTPGAMLQIKMNSNHAALIEEMYELAADPLLLSIVQKYMGVPPIFNTPVAFLNSFVKAKNDKALSDVAQLFHHDMHRLGFVKVFIYLTDVGPGSGPHTLVRGTHRKRPDHLWADGRHDDAAIAEAGLMGDEVRITGKAGTVFLVDTSCLHKGAHPDTEARLMAQVQYTNSLFGKPTAAAEHKIEMAATSKVAVVHEAAALVRKYTARAGVRFMQNYI